MTTYYSNMSKRLLTVDEVGVRYRYEDTLDGGPASETKAGGVWYSFSSGWRDHIDRMVISETWVPYLDPSLILTEGL